MGKNLIQQARGKGSPTYRSPSFRYKGETQYAALAGEDILTGTVIDLIDCAGHTAPLMKIKYANEAEALMIACEGIRVGDQVFSGSSAPVQPGSVMPLRSIPEGTLIYNIEIKPGDGGKLCKSSGTFCRVVA